MENNWREKASELLDKYISQPYLSMEKDEECTKAMLEAMNLVFEATKKECADKSTCSLYIRPNRKGTKYKKVEDGESFDIMNVRQMSKVDKESILNINKPKI